MTQTIVIGLLLFLVAILMLHLWKSSSNESIIADWVTRHVEQRGQRLIISEYKLYFSYNIETGEFDSDASCLELCNILGIEPPKDMDIYGQSKILRNIVKRSMEKLA